MERRPERWLTALRDALTNGSESAGRAAQCLDVIGSAEDVPLLRRFSKRRAAERDLGRGLARRVAEQVFVEDQGRVAITIGGRRVEGTQIRRKVLTLLCFLLSRPRFSSTRDEVLEALWPEFEPTVALNSLNQTVYFLRRVFEPSYREDTSPGYVRHESDVVWLDRQLVSSRSSNLRGLRAVARRRTPRLRRSAAAVHVSGSIRSRLRVRGLGRSASRDASRFVPPGRRETRLRATWRQGTGIAAS